MGYLGCLLINASAREEGREELRGRQPPTTPKMLNQLIHKDQYKKAGIDCGNPVALDEQQSSLEGTWQRPGSSALRRAGM